MSVAPGVHRVLGDPDAVAAALDETGWRVAVAAPAARTRELYDALSVALPLPDWFGRNLDALAEVLRDLDRPTALVLRSWTTYARARPERWAAVLTVLRERTRSDPPFVVVLAD